jgi:hypothetical protein
MAQERLSIIRKTEKSRKNEIIRLTDAVSRAQLIVDQGPPEVDMEALRHEKVGFNKELPDIFAHFSTLGQA